MGIFSAIRDAIFGPAGAVLAPSTPAEPQAAPAPTGPSIAATVGGAPAEGGAGPAPAGGWIPMPGLPSQGTTQPVDVEAVLREKLAAKGNPELNYQSSIVDLMKLLDLDSSLAARGQLADELGYTGAKDGSAEMNIWLHRKVMEELERNGGRVPESMKA